MTTEPQVFSLKEQLECVERQIRFNESLLTAIEEDDPKVSASLKIEIACLKSAHDTIHFEYLIEEAMLAEDRTRLEESIAEFH